MAISRFTEQRMRQLCPQVPIVNIPNGVDLTPFAQPAPRPRELPELLQPRGYFLYLGRLKQRKGVDVLLHALAKLPAASARPLVIAGGGEERAALEQLSTHLGLRERVFFVGPVQHPDKAYFLQNAIATVVPSRISEAFGLVALESFAAATPAIGSRLPGLEDVILPDRTGWLVATESTEELAAALHQAACNSQETHRLGRQAHAFAQDFDWSARGPATPRTL